MAEAYAAECCTASGAEESGSRTNSERVAPSRLGVHRQLRTALKALKSQGSCRARNLARAATATTLDENNQRQPSNHTIEQQTKRGSRRWRETEEVS
jgi:hypothetical protein